MSEDKIIKKLEDVDVSDTHALEVEIQKAKLRIRLARIRYVSYFFMGFFSIMMLLWLVVAGQEFYETNEYPVVWSKWGFLIFPATLLVASFGMLEVMTNSVFTKFKNKFSSVG